ncbi:YraN family protein [Flavobacterium sp. xlx-214]|uniref:YraN family protein n=1 Tax=unclassified Flavobacterium TaxID=196869 RepID=UPI0013D55DF0|nr:MULTISPECIES: YraN family protein [unclassified Flavobacterium]MBA5791963.1 YraN family protein [Flavobacterium sp. xlx-221]QMI84217.1 YraN family protein [Flavobacterium sp. xlx-214]
MAIHNDIGKKGEELAKDFLVSKGYEIIAQNYRYKKAEIDLIALHNNQLIVVEVKTRTSTQVGLPYEFVNKAKIKLMVLAINQFCEEHNLDNEIRFDIISIVIEKNENKIEHIENAFYHF